VVAKGDSLWGLARRYSSSVEQLRRLNALTPSAPLRPGQRLLVGRAVTTAANSSATARPTLQHTVRRGDTLSAISQRYRISVADLRKWNGLKADDYLHPGQKLVMPVDLTRQADGRDG